MAHLNANFKAVAGPALPTELTARVLEVLEDNDKALSVRFINKDMYRRFNQPEHLAARFSLPLPSSAIDAAWQPHLQRAFRQLTFTSKVNTLAVAASSGCEVNLEVAWGLVQPSVSLAGLDITTCQDPGDAAVRSGHLHLLPWLAQHGCVKRSDTLVAVLEHCDLAEVQRVWELLGCSGVPYGGFAPEKQRCLPEAAARSADPGMAKLRWLLSVMVDPTTQQHTRDVLWGTAVGAAASGKLDVLRWLCGQQGLDIVKDGAALLDSYDDATLCGLVLSCALQHEHVAVAEWLVGEVGCPLPLEQAQQQRERQLVWKAAGGGGSGAAVRWLLRREVPVHEGGLVSAAKAGKLEMVQFLREERGAPLTKEVFEAAARSGSVPTATWLLQAGCPMGEDAYLAAASAGDVAMLRWLAREAKCPWDDNTLPYVVYFWPSDTDSMGRLEATVRELVAAGCPPGTGAEYADGIVGFAAAKGHLALARYFHEELGFGFAPGTLAAAAAGGCEPVLEWLVGAGCVHGDYYVNPYSAAASCGDLGTMVCLRRLGVPWGPYLLENAVGRDVRLPFLRWLVEQGAPWDEAAIRRCVDVAIACKEFAESVAWFEERLDMYLTDETGSTESDGYLTIWAPGFDGVLTRLKFVAS